MWTLVALAIIKCVWRASSYLRPYSGRQTRIYGASRPASACICALSMYCARTLQDIMVGRCFSYLVPIEPWLRVELLEKGRWRSPGDDSGFAAGVRHPNGNQWRILSRGADDNKPSHKMTASKQNLWVVWIYPFRRKGGGRGSTSAGTRVNPATPDSRYAFECKRSPYSTVPVSTPALRKDTRTRSARFDRKKKKRTEWKNRYLCGAGFDRAWM